MMLGSRFEIIECENGYAVIDMLSEPIKREYDIVTDKHLVHRKTWVAIDVPALEDLIGMLLAKRIQAREKKSE